MPGESYFEFIPTMLMRMVEIVLMPIENLSINFLKKVYKNLHETE